MAAPSRMRRILESRPGLPLLLWRGPWVRHPERVRVGVDPANTLDVAPALQEASS